VPNCNLFILCFSELKVKLKFNLGHCIKANNWLILDITSIDLFQWRERHMTRSLQPRPASRWLYVSDYTCSTQPDLCQTTKQLSTASQTESYGIPTYEGLNTFGRKISTPTYAPKSLKGRRAIPHAPLWLSHSLRLPLPQGTIRQHFNKTNDSHVSSNRCKNLSFWLNYTQMYRWSTWAIYQHFTVTSSCLQLYWTEISLTLDLSALVLVVHQMLEQLCPSTGATWRSLTSGRTISSNHWHTSANEHNHITNL